MNVNSNFFIITMRRVAIISLELGAKISCNSFNRKTLDDCFYCLKIMHI